MAYGSFTAGSKEGSQETEEQEEVTSAPVEKEQRGHDAAVVPSHRPEGRFFCGRVNSWCALRCPSGPVQTASHEFWSEHIPRSLLRGVSMIAPDSG
jgi:hypothetical protein